MLTNVPRFVSGEGHTARTCERFMSVNFGPGFHAAPGARVDRSAYDRYTGLWSRLFVPDVLLAASHRVLDVATGPGEAASVALSQIGASGLVVGVDISPGMLHGGSTRFADRRFRPVMADGQALPFTDASFDAVICQLGLMSFPNPTQGLAEFRRVLRSRHCAAICVISARERAPMWGVLAEILSQYFPEQEHVLNLSFALGDADRLEGLMKTAGFREIRVNRTTRAGSFESFEDYWAPIEQGVGSLPQAYCILSERDRRVVRETVKERLSRFESNGRLVMSLEMLIASGRA